MVCETSGLALFTWFAGPTVPLTVAPVGHSLIRCQSTRSDKLLKNQRFFASRDGFAVSNDFVHCVHEDLAQCHRPPLTASVGHKRAPPHVG